MSELRQAQNFDYMRSQISGDGADASMKGCPDKAWVCQSGSKKAVFGLWSFVVSIARSNELESCIEMRTLVLYVWLAAKERWYFSKNMVSSYDLVGQCQRNIHYVFIYLQELVRLIDEKHSIILGFSDERYKLIVSSLPFCLKYCKKDRQLGQLKISNCKALEPVNQQEGLTVVGLRPCEILYSNISAVTTFRPTL